MTESNESNSRRRLRRSRQKVEDAAALVVFVALATVLTRPRAAETPKAQHEDALARYEAAMTLTQTPEDVFYKRNLGAGQGPSPAQRIGEMGTAFSTAIRNATESE